MDERTLRDLPGDLFESSAEETEKRRRQLLAAVEQPTMASRWAEPSSTVETIRNDSRCGWVVYVLLWIVGLGLLVAIACRWSICRMLQERDEI